MRRLDAMIVGKLSVDASKLLSEKNTYYDEIDIDKVPRKSAEVTQNSLYDSLYYDIVNFSPKDVNNLCKQAEVNVVPKNGKKICKRLTKISFFGRANVPT
jgi:hypothetical protein